MFGRRSIAGLLVSTTLLACTAARDSGDDEGASTNESRALTGGIPMLPWAGGTGAVAPWGGGDPARWRPEAILANAISQAMNDAWSRPDTKDAIVATPVKMLTSAFREFGDGQENAAPSFEWWRDSRPPVVATLIQTDAARSMVLKIDRALPNRDATWELSYNAGGTWKTVSLPITRAANGDGTNEWVLPAEVSNTQMLLVRPRTWGDWFPVWFRFPVTTVAALKADVPAPLKTFRDGGDIVDHEGVSLQTKPGTDTPYTRLRAHSFSRNYNPSPFMPPSIHARFPWGGREYTTGVGMGWTWVSDVPAAPFKIMYTCFEGRRPDLEKSAPDGGVASGGGWHLIGDAAETILNDLETVPLALGSSMSNPLPPTMLPSGAFAYNLSDVVTMRWVKPGEAFVTPRGGSTTDRAGRVWSQPNYHWYFFQGDRPVCTEEWMHPCVPTANGFSCTSQSQITFRVDNASTAWGENVYIVGDAKELGAWNAASAVKLSPTRYPTWTGVVSLPRKSTVRFKFIKKDGSGRITWEAGGDHVLTVGDAANGDFTASWR
jgi:hypothetical protein